MIEGLGILTIWPHMFFSIDDQHSTSLHSYQQTQTEMVFSYHKIPHFWTILYIYVVLYIYIHTHIYISQLFTIRKTKVSLFLKGNENC